jgi:hypothetical protein
VVASKLNPKQIGEFMNELTIPPVKEKKAFLLYPGSLRRLTYLSIFLINLLCWAVMAAEPLQMKDDTQAITFSSGPRLILRYNYGNVPFKPYVQQLFTPNGVNVLLDAPSDHLHHHALMFAVGVNGVNFWEERGQPGRQQHRSLEKIESSNSKRLIGFQEQLDWKNTADGQLLLREHRKLEIPLLKKLTATVLTWQTSLVLPEDVKSAKLTGEHFYGLGMRFVRAMDGQGPFLNAGNLPGEIFRGEERLINTSWCAYSAGIDGKPVTVAMFGHPDNPQSPTTWFTMAKPFAYLAATMNLLRQPYELTAGTTLNLRYCIAVWDGQIAKEKIDELFRWWLNWEK